MSANTVARRLGRPVARVLRMVWGFAAVALFAVLLWDGWFPGVWGERTADLRTATGAAVLAGILAAKLAGRMKTPERRRSPKREAMSDIELGLLLIAAAYVFMSILGGSSVSIHPLVYALVSFLVTFHKLGVGLPLAAGAIGFEAILSFAPHVPPGAGPNFWVHSGFIGVFALLNVVFLHAEVARQRGEHRNRLEQDLAAMREEARDFRLISSSLNSDGRQRSRAEDEEKLSLGSIETIHQQLYATLDLVRRSLGLQTCALLWLDARGERLKIKELTSESANVTEEAMPAGIGAVGAVIKDARPVVLARPRAELLPYYDGSVEVVAFAGVPVLEGKTVRGVLVADRGSGAPFEKAEVELLIATAEQVTRIVQSERVFQAVERAKHEHERFYQASSELNRAFTLDEVYDAALAGARGVCEFDLAVIATHDPRTSTHTICRADGELAHRLTDKEFRDPAALVSMVVKNKIALPAGGDWRERNDDVFVFDTSVRLRQFESLLSLPLVSQDKVIGTFTVAAKRPGAFPRDRREMLGVIANQVAISLQNAKINKALEEQATTDGLTGLVNHRTFQERLSDLLGRAERVGFQVSILLTDIDHFKKINDNYGHPTGDEVLRRVSRLLKDNARKVDIVARYGGEEFAIVLMDNGREDARLKAEQIREEVSRQIFESAKGPFKATMSLGIAVFPEDARSKQELITRADQALYAAKHGGRNRAMAWKDVEQTPRRAVG